MKKGKMASSSKNFFRNRFIEIIGVGFLAFALFATISFLTYDPFDPSLNLVSNAKVKNLGGVAGAYISGPVLSFLGLGCIALIIIPAAWGWNMVKKNKPSRLWLKTTFLIFALPLTAGLFALLDAAFSVPKGWPSSSFGGFIGSYMFDKASPVITPWGFAAAAILFSLTTIFLAAGLTRRQWGNMMRHVYSAVNINRRFI